MLFLGFVLLWERSVCARNERGPPISLRAFLAQGPDRAGERAGVLLGGTWPHSGRSFLRGGGGVRTRWPGARLWEVRLLASRFSDRTPH